MKIDLDELIHAQVIDPEAAVRIKEYYQTRQGTNQKSNLIRLVSIIGVTMVGLGLLLIVAYNWDQMPKSLKLIWAIIPLLVAQCFGLYTLLKKNSNTAWREVSSLAILFGIGISLALITQIYQLDYSLSEYIKWWILLSLPLIYIFNSSVTSCSIWIGVSWYLIDARWSDASYNIWLVLGILLVAVIPYIWKVIKKQSRAGWAWHHWIVPLVLMQFIFTLNPLICTTLTMVHVVIMLLAYDTLSETYLADSSLGGNGYKVISFVGITIIAFMMTFKYFWLESAYPDLRTCTEGSHWIVPGCFGLLLLMMLIYRLIYNKADDQWIIPGVAIVLILFILLAPSVGSAGRIIINLMVLSATGLLMYQGISKSKLPILNLGIVLLGIWVICRFFESDISFIWRGVIFIVLGLLCFLLNYSLISKKSS